MSLNIIVKGGKSSGGMSGEEMADYLSRKVEADARREKAGYKGRASRARKYGQSVGGGKDFRAVSSIDMVTYMRHEQERPGCMSDPEYRKDFAKANPETVIGS
jgi:hypothetical protein